jgi:FAD/FMN-containing dehydrogenase
MSSEAATASPAQQLASAFSGRIIDPAHSAYDTVRRLHNGLVDKRPALIAECRGVADVVDAVKFARAQGLEIAVRGGGHNVAGRASVDKGLMIDLAQMRGVSVDLVTAVARAEGGTTWKVFNRETQLHGLATTGGVVGTTGIGGLTLGGGLGWLMPKYGMALDNLKAVDLVLADGQTVRASKQEHPDLFWAVRGGGGNFGVATSFEFALHPVGPIVIGGLAAWPFEMAKDVLKLFRDLAAKATDDVMLVAALLTAPDGKTKVAAMALGHFGSRADGERAIAPMKAFKPILDELGPIPYTALNGLLDGAFPPGAFNYWKTHFLNQLTDDAMDALIDSAASCPTPMGQVVIEHFHGAATRVPVGDTAYALRSSGFNIAIVSEWLDRAHDEKCIGWGKKAFSALQPFAGSQRYINYLNHDDALDTALTAVYGPNLPRLQQIKKQYDPENVFHHNVNIKPA